jgi:cobalt-zinc-cadmium resistance protein CzcA
MIGKLIEWAVNNRFVVFLLALALAVIGGYAFLHTNVEAYPDPAPAIVEIATQYPGASAEEVERQVTIPIEVALAGMPGLTEIRSKSLFGLSYVSSQFEYGIEFNKVRLEVLSRIPQGDLPAGVSPQISPASPIAEIVEYVLLNPKDALGRGIYTLNDIKALHDWPVKRAFRRLPRIADAVSFGGSMKRYEVQPDPERLKQYGITLQQLQSAITASNANVGGDYLPQGHTVQVVRGLGLIGGGKDPMQRALTMKDATTASDYLREEEERRLQEIRLVGVAATNNVPVRVNALVDGGPLRLGDDVSDRGVIVGERTRLGRVGFSYPRTDAAGREVRDARGVRVWIDEPDVVQGTVYMRKGEESLPALRDVMAKIKEMNDSPGHLLPGVNLKAYYDRTELIDATLETVRENLLLGLVLVAFILLMFLSNVRTALIVAINIPLALLFAFATMFLRGKSANLLSIGAVDFGIIVDSSVIMVENIYRHVSSGEHADLPLKERILRASREVERSLFFSTVIMVCALLPLFTMKGPEGQIFGPMADTYAFALGGALLLALTLSPVLCLIFFKNLKPARDNLLVRGIKRFYLWQLDCCLNYRWLALGGVGLLVAATVYALPNLGREFMPELEEGNLYIRAVLPMNVSLEEANAKIGLAREIIRKYPEVQTVMSQTGRPDEGTDPIGFYNSEIMVPLKSAQKWEPVKRQEGWRAYLFGDKRPRTKAELIEEMNAELADVLIGVDWTFSQNIRDNVMEVLSGVKGENSVKIIGPDLEELERLAEQAKTALAAVNGVENPGVLHIKGQVNLEFPIDRAQCALWNVSVADVHNVIETAVGGKPFTQMIEGEKIFDVSLRWPQRLRQTEDLILSIPVDIDSHTVTAGSMAAAAATPVSGASTSLAASGTSLSMPALTGSIFDSTLTNLSVVPRRPLRTFVTPVDADGRPDRKGRFTQPGAVMIQRESGHRLIAVKFGVRGRDLASTVAEAQKKIEPMLPPGYSAEWGGEFQEMQEAEHRLVAIVSLSMVLILILLYLAFRSLLDAVTVMSGVGAVSIGGIWALLLTDSNFNISAAVGFISILGVAIMNGLLMISSFNALRAQGVRLREAITRGMEKLVRPVTMTALAAIIGLLPAAFSTRIGSESQKPLAIAVVGGMVATLVLTNLVPVLYSFYGKRQPPAGAGQMAH